MYRDVFSNLRYNYFAVIVIMVGGALLLWLVLHYAFSVTSNLVQPTPPIE